MMKHGRTVLFILGLFLGIFGAVNFSLAETIGTVSSTASYGDITWNTTSTITQSSSPVWYLITDSPQATDTLETTFLNHSNITASTTWLGGNVYELSNWHFPFGGSFPQTFSNTSEGGGIAVYDTSYATIFTNTTYEITDGSPEVSFVFPTNTSTTYDFTDWELNFSGLDNSLPYTAIISYGSPQNPKQYSDSVTLPLAFSGNLFIPKTISLASPFVSTSSWVASVQLIAPPTLITSSSINFVVSNNGLIINNEGTSTFTTTNPINSLGGGALPAVNATCAAPTSSIFSDPATYTAQSFAYGLCNVSVFLFIPSSNISDYFQGSVTNLQAVMPFSLGYDVLNAVENATATSSVPSEQDATFYMDGGSQGTIPITFISSSTLSTAFGSSNKNLILTWEGYEFYILTLMAMFFSVYEFVHVIAGHKPNKIRNRKK